MGHLTLIQQFDTTVCAVNLEQDTRTRLVEAAGAIFAEKGFKAATIREIVGRAGANLAAVNYHFGDKHGLYAAVIRETARQSLEVLPADEDVPPEAPAQQRLTVFLRNILLRGLRAGQSPWQGRLMAREMADADPATLEILAPLLRPVHDYLAGLVRELAGSPLPERQVWLCVNSIIAQCVLYNRWEPIGESLHRGLLPAAPERVAILAEHITRFSLAALRGYSPKETP